MKRHYTPLVAYLVLVGAMCVAFYQADQSRNKLRAEAASTQLAETRSCIRGNLGAALRQVADPSPVLARLSPLLDCKRSLIEDRTIPLSPKATKDYIAVVADGKFPVVNKGQVVGTRASLLEGVESLDQLGKP